VDVEPVQRLDVDGVPVTPGVDVTPVLPVLPLLPAVEPALAGAVVLAAPAL
jgi:hypothetical protein